MSGKPSELKELGGSSSTQPKETLDALKTQAKEGSSDAKTLVEKRNERENTRFQRYNAVLAKFEKLDLDPMTKFQQKAEIEALNNKQNNARRDVYNRYNQQIESSTEKFNSKNLGGRAFDRFKAIVAKKGTDGDLRTLYRAAEQEERKLADIHSSQWDDLENQLGLK